MLGAEIQNSIAEKQKICRELGESAPQAQVGKMVAKHEELILGYYKDVLAQAKASFSSAKWVAIVGFAVLIITVAYFFITDVFAHMGKFGFTMHDHDPKPSYIGVVSGGLIEFIAAINFWLYSRVAKQFAAFHICLERTHRYLLAYSIADQITDQKNDVLGKLVCIMANAPMITLPDTHSDLARAAEVPANQADA